MYFFKLLYFLSSLDSSESLDLYCSIGCGMNIQAFFPSFQHVFSSLVLFVFTAFLFFFCFPPSFPPVVFVLVFCSCLHYFRYFFPPLDSPRAGSRWSSCAQLLPPPAPLLEHSCDADTANLHYPHPRRGCLSRPLNPLPENEGV